MARVGEAAKAAHRDPTSVDLIVVSKTFASDRIAPILAAGHRSFGENRVQEAQGKWPDLKAAYPDTQLHLIGPLQSNKAADAVTLFDVIHTVDRPKIAAALAREMARQQRSPALFVQVNTGEEPQKAGVMPADTVAFVETCRREHALAPVGLMCIPPVDEEASIHFAFLAELAERCGLSALSMGMSADFETAISFGATHVRVGSAVFGAR
ncbi:MAG: YggS family pyridoxal phosphate-dependent enzyme [Pseudomonadota bacterium]